MLRFPGGPVTEGEGVKGNERPVTDREERTVFLIHVVGILVCALNVLVVVIMLMRMG